MPPAGLILPGPRELTGVTDVVVLGQIARDLVLMVDELPAPGSAAPVRQRREMLGLVALAAGQEGNVFAWPGGGVNCSCR